MVLRSEAFVKCEKLPVQILSEQQFTTYDRPTTSETVSVKPLQQVIACSRVYFW